MLIRRVVLVALWGALVLLLAGCAEPSPRVVRVSAEFATPVAAASPPEGYVEVGALATMEATELRRIRGEHIALIESAAAKSAAETDAAVVAETVAPAEVQARALARVLAAPEGMLLPVDPDQSWFHPDRGLTFFRMAGGDWTASSVRESHTHRNLFYYPDYPAVIDNFEDGSIYPDLARELAFAGVDLVKVLGEPHPGMVEVFARNLGWELRDTAGPVINLWTHILVVDDGLSTGFAVGGVMRLGVRSVGEGADRLDYLVAGRWIGPVVVERLY